MINGGNATIFVSDFERAIHFYTEILGMPLRLRAENFWAEVVAGKDLVIGIHPESGNAAKPGTRGSIQIGLNVTGPLHELVDDLKVKGVEFDGPIVEDDGVGKFARFRDPDGNALYFWEPAAVAPRD